MQRINFKEFKVLKL